MLMLPAMTAPVHYLVSTMFNAGQSDAMMVTSIACGLEKKDDRKTSEDQDEVTCKRCRNSVAMNPTKYRGRW